MVNIHFITDFFIFLIIYLLFFISSIGFGIGFLKIIKFNVTNHNISLFSLFGIIFLTFFSYLSILFTSHNSYFNILVHTFGLFIFFQNLKIINFKLIDIIFILILFSALIVFKNNEDFPYYHFQQALNFSENKFQFGLSNLEISFAHHSSLLYLNSLFYIPYYKYFFFNVPNLILYTSLCLIFFNKTIYEKNLFFRFYALFTITYFLVKFDRLSEYGTDIVGQFLIILFSYHILKIILSEKKSLDKNEFIIITSLICFCITIKTYFIVYLLLYALILLKINFRQIYISITENYFFSSFIILFFLLFLILNLFTTGCLIYPLTFLCFDNLVWAMPINEVASLKNWYEAWSKSLAGAGYRVDNYEELIHNFSWVKYWMKNYFQSKMLDNLLAFAFLTLIMFFLFRSKKKIKTKINLKNLKIFYFIIIFLFIFWFIKHPTLRYGGYSIILVLFAVPISLFLSTRSINILNLNKKIKMLVFFGLFIFLSTNINRIYSEFFSVNSIKIANFPFFWVPSNLKYEIKNLNGITNVYTPINNNCWDIPTPCPGGDVNLKAKKKLGFVLFYKDK